MRGTIISGAAVVISLCMAGSPQAQAPTPAPVREANRMRDTALVIIDIQNFYFEGGKLPLVGPVEASLQAGKLLERFRQLGLPVIHVQHLPKGQAVPDPIGGDVQYRIHANVLPRPGETVVGKHEANSFRDTDLLERLRAMGVQKLVICGMQTHMCVEAATRAAADLGFEVTLVGDACATRDLSFGGTSVPAAQVHTAVLAAMKGNYARVVSTAELLGELR
jgi:nicotinamidase-related amidase